MIWQGKERSETKETDIYSYIFRNVQQYAELPALLEYQSGRELLYGKLVDQVGSTARGLRKLGVKKGSVVAVVGPYYLDQIESVLAWFAALKIGAVVMLVEVMFWDEAFLLFQLEEVKVDCIISPERYLSKVELILSKLRLKTKNDPHIVVIDKFNTGKYHPFTSLQTDNSSDLDVTVSDESPIMSSELGLIEYTSGTAGRPKGVLMSHRALIHAVQSLAIAQEDITLPGQASVMIFGNVNVYAAAVNTGMKYIVMDAPLTEKSLLLEAALKLKVTFTGCPVDVTDKLGRRPIPEVKHRFIWSGSAPLRRDVVERFYQAYSDTKLIQHYGSTEDGMVAVAISGVNGIHAANSHSVGKPLAGVEIKITRLDTGKEIGPDEAGEVWVRSPGLMSGYLNRPEVEKIVLQDGWYRTGDYGYVDKDGFLYITDRIRDLIHYKGNVISATELETWLCRHPGVDDAAVIGVPGETGEHVPRAYVVKADVELTEPTLISYIEEKCEDHYFLRGGVVFVSCIPRKPTGKMMRQMLLTH